MSRDSSDEPSGGPPAIEVIVLEVRKCPSLFGVAIDDLEQDIHWEMLVTINEFVEHDCSVTIAAYLWVVSHVLGDPMAPMLEHRVAATPARIFLAPMVVTMIPCHICFGVPITLVELGLSLSCEVPIPVAAYWIKR